ncbi:MAG: DNA repair protein RecN [Rhodospirillaceae bacterium]|nr:DNA repair protein RecN [Rhodospirillaceae bacterium]
MLTGLSIRNLLLIEALDLQFEAALTALTGETGAGKSILLASLGLALGGRSDARFVRGGSDRATVSASFEIGVGHPAGALLADQGLELHDGELILRRVLGADGRSRAFVNDQPVGVGLLRSIGSRLAEIHGQFDQTGLLDTATHRQLLDSFGRHRRELDAVADSWRQLTETREALDRAERDAAEARRDEDYLRHLHGELRDLAPAADEEESLAAERARLANSGKLIEAAQEAIAAIGPDSRADEALGTAARALDRAAALAPDLLQPAVAALDRATIELNEVHSAAIDLAAQAEAEPARLEAVDDRLAALRDAARKHRCEVGQLPLLLDRITERLSSIDDSSGELAEIRRQADVAALAYRSAARKLSNSRRAAAGALDAAIARELPPLKLDRARFVTQVSALDERQASANGLDRIAFEVATTPGAEPGPIGRIASGGELARIMLALRVVLAQDDGPGTMIFDEVDSGVGGATAAAVGERLARLGERAQVLVVTHSPQVAAKARQHWRVIRADMDESAVASVSLLNQDERQEEIARMLSGAAITDEARAAATALMATGS